MPIYEYKCGKCGTVNEFIVFGDTDGLQCKSCSSTDLTKIMSAHNTSSVSPQFGGAMPSGGCCGSPGSCGTPGSCCGG
ncbi:MAG TPA: zinc ribbon domain-containing protein [Syntrophorhabdaceae bacterium]|nr:zinc ribbon domain-containing protein [Syntrophorhabdaceae bacterium]